MWHTPSAKEARRLRVRSMRVARCAAEGKLAGCVWGACMWHAANETAARRVRVVSVRVARRAAKEKHAGRV